MIPRITSQSPAKWRKGVREYKAKNMIQVVKVKRVKLATSNARTIGRRESFAATYFVGRLSKRHWNKEKLYFARGTPSLHVKTPRLMSRTWKHPLLCWNRNRLITINVIGRCLLLISALGGAPIEIWEGKKRESSVLLLYTNNLVSNEHIELKFIQIWRIPFIGRM